MIPGNRDTRDGILFSLPFMIVFALFMVYPLVFGFYISFFKWNILGTPSFLGIQNYVDIMHDEKFWSSLWHTVQFVLMTTPVLIVMGFLMALLATSHSPTSRTYQGWKRCVAARKEVELELLYSKYPLFSNLFGQHHYHTKAVARFC